MKKTKLKIGGMHCTSCASSIERVVGKIDGVDKVQVVYSTETMLLEYNERLDFKNVTAAIESLEFTIKSEDTLENSKKEKNNLIVTCILAAILFIVSMSQMFEIINLNIKLLSLFESVICTIIILINLKVYRAGYKTLLKLSPTMESLIAIGTTASYLYSIYGMYQILSGTSHHLHLLYFESTATILALVKFGKYVEAKSKLKTKNAVEELMSLAPDKATVSINNEEIERNIEDINVGDIIIVKNGFNIPLDGKIVEGHCTVDESAITGESIPVDKTTSDKVVAGTVNLNGYIKVQVEKGKNDTMIAKIVEYVENTQNSKAKTQRLADLVSKYFTFGILILAILSVILWIIIDGNFTAGFISFVNVLVIACPCALGLAIPLCIMVSSGKGAKFGILFKNAETIENLEKVDTVVLDKTGTITTGKIKVTGIMPFKYDQDELVKRAASIEANSEHPISKAVVNYAKENHQELYLVENFKNIVGFGVYGKIDKDDIYICNMKQVEKLNINMEEHISKINELYKNGYTLLFVIENLKIIGCIAVSDVIKDESKDLIAKLKKNKIETYMITGDTENTASIVARDLGIDYYYSSILPNDKAKIVEELQKNGKNVLFVGDGINDSPALSRANVGMSIGTGTDIAINTSDVVLISNNILDVMTSINLSVKTVKTMKENLFLAFIYNIVCIPIAMGLFMFINSNITINPMISAFAMSLSSITVVTNSLKINNIKKG